MNRAMREEYERWICGLGFTQYLVLTLSNEALERYSLGNADSVARLVEATLGVSGHKGQWVATLEKHTNRDVYHVNLLTEPSPRLERFVRLWRARYGWVNWNQHADAGAVRYVLKEIITDDDMASHFRFQLRRAPGRRTRRRGRRGRGGRPRVAHT